MKRRRELVAVARALLVLVGLSPFAPPLLAAAGATPLAGVLDAWFRFQCERDPLRMLGVGAVCARCLGLYVGLGAGALLARPRLGGHRLELWLAVAALAMLADVGSEWLGWRAAWAPLRLATGLFLGYPAGVAVVVGLEAWARGVVAAAPVTARDG
jgi:uncharacterized membrane protein